MQGTPGNLTISWYRDNIPIRSVSSMQVVIYAQNSIQVNILCTKPPKKYQIPPQHPYPQGQLNAGSNYNSINGIG